jgi:hypothetical protein
MFRLATAPALPIFGRRKLEAVPASTAAKTAVRTAPAPTADIRIRRFSESEVHEDTWTAILPAGTVSPADLLRIISEACKDLPEFQVRDEADEKFILSLTLKG